MAIALLEQLCATSGFTPSFITSVVPQQIITASRDASDTDDSGLITEQLRPLSTRSSFGLDKPFHHSVPIGISGGTIAKNKFLTSATLLTILEISIARNNPTYSSPRYSASPLMRSSSCFTNQTSINSNRAMLSLPKSEEDDGEATETVDTAKHNPPAETELPGRTDSGRQHTLQQKVGHRYSDMLRNTTRLPNLEMIIDALKEARKYCDANLIMVFDGWHEDNMIEPDKFKVLLNSLRNSRCKIFLTSRPDLEVPKPACDRTVFLPVSSKGRYQLDDIVLFTQGLMLAGLGHTDVTPEVEEMIKWIVQRSNGVYVSYLTDFKLTQVF